MSVLDQGLPVLTAQVKVDLNLSTAGAALIVLAPAIGRTLGVAPAGRIADRIGEIRVLIVGAVAVSAFCLVAAAAPSLAALATLLALAGLFSSVTQPGGVRLVAASFPAERRGFVIAVRQCGVPVGGVIGALALPAVALWQGWRAGVVAIAAFAALSSLVVLSIARNAKRTAERRVVNGTSRDPTAAIGINVPQLARLIVWGMIMVVGQYAFLVYISLYLTSVGSNGVVLGPIVVATAQAAGVAGRLGWGSLSDVLGVRSRQTMLVVTLLAAGVIGALAALPNRPPAALVIAISLGYGVTAIGWNGLWIAAVWEVGGPARGGTTAGVALAFINLAALAGPVALGLLADAADGYRVVWIVVAFAVLASTATLVGSTRSGSGTAPRSALDTPPLAR